MADRPTTTGRPRGGGQISPSRNPGRARLITAFAAIALAAALGAWNVLAAARLQALWISLAATGVVCISAGLALRRPAAIHLALWLLVGAYTARLLIDSAALDPAAPAYGAGVLVCSELADWSLQLRAAAQYDAALVTDRLARTLALALAGIVVGSLALAAATLNVARSLPLTAAGAAAAAAALWLLAILARRQRRLRRNDD